jgi:hypothetical protein
MRHWNSFCLYDYDVDMIKSSIPFEYNSSCSTKGLVTWFEFVFEFGDHEVLRTFGSAKLCDKIRH